MSLARRRGERQTVKSAGGESKGLAAPGFQAEALWESTGCQLPTGRELLYTLKELGVASQSQTEAGKPEMETRNRPLDF